MTNTTKRNDPKDPIRKKTMINHILNLVYFSPTRTTQKVLSTIAAAYSPKGINNWDLTLKEEACQNKRIPAEELTIFAAPVYAGRIPADAAKRFDYFRGEQSPAVLVVTYGNREFEDALLELRHLVEKKGFVIIAAAAFIGEHSYSTPEKPIAAGRPDPSDLDKARQFGISIREKTTRQPSITNLPPLQIPGNFPYKVPKVMTDFAPETDTNLCSECFDCIAVCPVEAISPGKPDQTSKMHCIHCCACVKICPTGARQMNNSQIKTIADWLVTNYGTRKEPETFI